MPTYNQKSLEKLKQCHSEIQLVFNNVIQFFDHIIITGYRSETEQMQAFANGNSQLKWPLSKHNQFPAMAVDAIPNPVDWNDLKRIYYFAGLVKGVSDLLRKEGKIIHEIRFGGDWDRDTEIKDNKFNDLTHFELIL